MSLKHLMYKHLIVFITILAAIGNLKADGKYFPEKAFKISPQIPNQRAMIAYKDGQEKLIIESSFDGQGQQFGWVIPVPSNPISFDVISPGLLETMSLVLQPQIVHDLGAMIELVVMCVIFLTILIFLHIFGSPKTIKGKILEYGLLLLLLLFLLSIFMPALGVAGGGFYSEIGVDVLEEQTVGNYTVSVLSAENPEGIDNWLDENGFAGLSLKEKEIVADYIKNKWCFIAAKLNKDKKGLARPHPIAINFKTSDAVYPMRLTGQTQSSVYLDLYIISNKMASCKPLRQEVCNYFCYEKELKHNEHSGEFFGGFVGGFDQTVGHPAASQVLWDGCVITRLSGQVKPEQMDKDYYIDWKPFESNFRQTYFSPKGSRSTGFILGVLFWLSSLLVLTVSRRKYIQSAGGKQFAFKKVLLPSAVGAIIVGVIAFYCVPKTDVGVSRGHKIFFLVRMSHVIEEWFEKHPVILQKTDVYSVQEYLEKEIFLNKFANYYTQKPIKIEDSPGNVTVGRDDKSGLFIRTYNYEGFPLDFYFCKYNEN